MVVETLTFRPAAGATEHALLDADRRVQTEAVPTLTGFLRRTTARSSDGEWLVVTLWWSDDAADEAATRLAEDAAMQAFLALATDVRRARYRTLD